MNILSVFQEHALNNGNIALKCYDREISFSDLYIISNSISKDLVHKNIIGDIIGIYDNGSIEHFLLMLACMQANIPFINLDVKAPINYIKNILITVTCLYLSFTYIFTFDRISFTFHYFIYNFLNLVIYLIF